MKNNLREIETKLISLPTLERLKYYLYAFTFLFKKKQKRTTNQISKEYEHDIYETLLQNKIWDDSDLESICYTRFINNKIENNSTQTSFIYNDNFFKTELYEIKKIYTSQIIKKMKQFTSKSEIICELGCGFGKNLFLLRLDGFKNSLEGYDLSKNAISIANKINLKFNTNIKFDCFNMIQDIPKINLENKTIFTHLSLEQLKYDLESIILNLINSKASQIIHFEHVSEMYSFSLRHIASKIYYSNRDYQSNLYKILIKFEKQKLLKITDIEKFPFTFNPSHEMGFIRWVPLKNSN